MADPGRILDADCSFSASPADVLTYNYYLTYVRTYSEGTVPSVNSGRNLDLDRCREYIHTTYYGYGI